MFVIFVAFTLSAAVVVMFVPVELVGSGVFAVRDSAPVKFADELDVSEAVKESNAATGATVMFVVLVSRGSVVVGVAMLLVPDEFAAMLSVAFKLASVSFPDFCMASIKSVVTFASDTFPDFDSSTMPPKATSVPLYSV